MFRFFTNTLLMSACLLFQASVEQVLAQNDAAPLVLPPPGAAVAMPSPRAVPAIIASSAAPGTETLAISPTDAVTTAAFSTPIAEEASTVLAAAPVIVASTPQWHHMAYWFGPTPWDIGFELGINGTEGINDALSFRTGGHLKRETDSWKFDTSLFYSRNSANGLETQNNALLDVRIDRKLGDSPWSLYFLNQELYDEFQTYDLRVSANSGVGYQWVDTEHLDVVGRFGAGASREFGGPDDSTAYEALFGLECAHELSKTQRLSAKIDYFPEWVDFHQYRVVTDLGWEIDLDRPSNVSLKLSITDRYDSTPDGADPNEVNYSVLLIWRT